MKSIFGHKVRSSYETELKITLLLILLFLILANFSTLRVSGKLSKIYKEDKYHQLEIGAGKLIDYVDDNVANFRLTRHFREILSHTTVTEAAFVQADYLKYPEKFRDSLVTQEMEYISNYYSTLPADLQNALESGQVVEYGFGRDQDRNKIAILVFFTDGQGKDWIGLFLNNAGGLKLVTTIMRFNFIFQIAGILAILLVAYAYLKITLNPFRRIATEAKKVHHIDKRSGESVEQIVETFRMTIGRLQENEEKLKELYNNSQARAARLEQFNLYILESMLSGLIGIDTEGRIIHLNQSARTILKLRENLINMQSFRDTFADYKPLIDSLENILANRATIERQEYRLVQKSGLQKILGISGSPVHDHKGRIVGAILILADMTEVRRLQKEIVFKEKMAAVGEMSAGLAHEMRNAMMAIVGYSKYLKKLSAEDSPIQEVVSSIRAESANCETMLKRFLLFAKPTAFSSETISLVNAAAVVIYKLKQYAISKDISISENYRHDIPNFTGDKTAIDQIITNLVKNAIEAAPNGGQVGLQIKYDFTKSIFAIEITDNGPGIPPENLDKIFSPFFSTKEKGTGLGLAIAKKLVTGMGGSIDVNPKAGGGCKFIVMLPLEYGCPETEFSEFTGAISKR